MADGRDRKNSQSSSSPNVGTLASLLGSGGTSYVLPTLGLAAGAAGIHNLNKSNRGGTGKGVLQGAASGAAAGASIGSLVPVVGTVIGGAAGGVLGGAYGAISQHSRTEKEDKRRDNLAKQGINLYNGEKGWEEKYNAVINPNFAKDFVGADDKGNWVNNKFASTRDESALTGRDIDKYAAWSEMFGDKWNKASDDTRYKIGDEAVKRGLLREHHGTLDVNSNDEFNSFASSLLDTPKAKSTQTGQRRETRGISPRKEDPKERRVVSRKPAPPVNLDAILPRISQPEPFVNYDNEPTQEETTNRNRYKDAILAQLMSRV
jgi:hypothetical protein